MIVQKFADKINKRLCQNNPTQKFDPLLVLALISFIINAIRLWIECGREDKPSPNQSWFVRKLLERKARQALVLYNLDKKLAPELVKMALEELNYSSHEDLVDLVEEIN